MKTKPAEAVQIDVPFEVDTLEGEGLSGKAGDYLMRGVKGELYPCDREIFEETYAPESRLSELESRCEELEIAVTNDYTDGYEDGYGVGLRHGHAQADRGEGLPEVFDEHETHERKPTSWHRERADELAADCEKWRIRAHKARKEREEIAMELAALKAYGDVRELKAERDKLKEFIDYLRNRNNGMGATARRMEKVQRLEGQIERANSALHEIRDLARIDQGFPECDIEQMVDIYEVSTRALFAMQDDGVTSESNTSQAELLDRLVDYVRGYVGDRYLAGALGQALDIVDETGEKPGKATEDEFHEGAVEWMLGFAEFLEGGVNAEVKACREALDTLHEVDGQGLSSDELASACAALVAERNDERDRSEKLEAERNKLRSQLHAALRSIEDLEKGTTINELERDREELQDRIDRAITASEEGSASDAIQDMLFILRGDSL